MNTGENAEALRKITDLVRKSSIVILGLHFYYYCYQAFIIWGFTYKITEQVLAGIAGTGLFRNFFISKFFSLGLLVVSLVGIMGKKNEKLTVPAALRPLIIGLVVFGLSHILLKLDASVQVLAGLYMIITSLGFLLILHGGTLLTRLLKDKLQGDIFNKLQETFPQEERLLENEYSINLPAKYNFKGKVHNSYINLINPFRGSLLCGTPGSGRRK
ncbi:YWFCY domain-containing protein [Chitinophaga varians]|uniref:YWFCY domain-containing protein n=1 Tax=Chitinophaga varians TaxID=2202339 RepID=UPI001FFD9E4E|nr:YWFCY domain-containing protein [Chitinophaga varians]